MLYNILEYMKNKNRNYTDYFYSNYIHRYYIFFKHNSYYKQQAKNIIYSQKIAVPIQLQVYKYYNLTNYFQVK